MYRKETVDDTPVFPPSVPRGARQRQKQVKDDDRDLFHAKSWGGGGRIIRLDLSSCSIPLATQILKSMGELKPGETVLEMVLNRSSKTSVMVGKPKPLQRR